MLSKEFYNKIFAGYHIYDCVVKSNDYLGFILLENLESENEPEKRLVTLRISGTKNGKLASTGLSGYQFPKLAAAQKPIPQLVLCSLRGKVFADDGANDISSGPEEIPMSGGPNCAMDTSVHALTNIDGYVYAVGPWRSVCKRVDIDKWVSIADRENSMPSPKAVNGSTDSGFDAISAFNAQDIYCAGGYGDVWRFDGKHWHQCEIQNSLNVQYNYRVSQNGEAWSFDGKHWKQVQPRSMKNICCAEDGNVYVGLNGGSIIKGRENKWKLIYEGEMNLPFKDIVSYAGKIWCTSEYGLWVLENNKLLEADVPAEIKRCSGHLSVGDGIMLLAGNNGAAVFDGKNWEVVVSSLAYL